MKVIFVLILAISISCNSQTWTAIPKCPINASTILLLRDGRVIAHEGDTSSIAILTPDTTGSYINGTWSMGSPLPTGYAPYAFSSAVLPDGRVIFEGGEYNNGLQNFTNLGAIYDAKLNQWTPVLPPAGWVTIGDASSVVLFNGTYMQGNCCAHLWQTAFLNPTTLTWTEGPNGLGTNMNEANWTLLPNGNVLNVAVETICGTDKGSQIYQASTNTWICGPELPQLMYDDSQQYLHEVGSTVLTYNGNIVQVGGNNVIATALLNVAANTWTNGPVPPVNFNQQDAPSVLEPNGNILMLLWNNDPINISCQFFEYITSTNTLNYVPNPPECPYGHADSNSRLIPLPTGQILFAHFDQTLEVYTPPQGVLTAAVPAIYPTSLVLFSGTVNNILYGKQLNGLSQAVFYGDDYQGATNYPLIQLTDTQGNVHFAPTYNDSYSGIGFGAISYTHFDMPTLPTGNYMMRVVTNGIPSNNISVQVAKRN